MPPLSSPNLTDGSDDSRKKSILRPVLARSYQFRSKKTISPTAGRCATMRTLFFLTQLLQINELELQLSPPVKLASYLDIGAEHTYEQLASLDDRPRRSQGPGNVIPSRRNALHTVL